MVGMNCKNLEILKRNLMDPCEVERLEHMRRFVPHTYGEKTAIDIYGNADAHKIGRHMRQLKHLELRFSSMNDKDLLSSCRDGVWFDSLCLSWQSRYSWARLLQMEQWSPRRSYSRVIRATSPVVNSISVSFTIGLKVLTEILTFATAFESSNSRSSPISLPILQMSSSFQ
ncbi:unnamed protein product [Microthlaspi erraticum]|uniref:Uncharacterized protein n=1 Tax=Microthlaspi erraticum TaxID=1685480 RepID=A0A6D2KPB1_9BRAS|nr:unnamed protein product [Microthlaspi erraticum]CAA7058782.1 unnamed protein product [Microthlaspi erraticum]